MKTGAYSASLTQNTEMPISCKINLG